MNLALASSSASWRMSHGVVVVAVLGLWLAPSTAAFVLAWALFFAWATLRASGEGATWFAPVVVLVCGAVPVLPLVGHFEGPWVVGLAAAMAGGVVPFHLWLSALERRLSTTEFQIVLLGQPGLVWLHRYVSVNGPLEGLSGDVLLFGLVASALVMTGLGLVRREPSRAVTAVVLSQSMLALAGAVGGDTGWLAARLMWVSMAIGTVVLQGLIADLGRRYDLQTLAPDHGLASTEPAAHRLFVTMGWLMVGVPGGVAFFAQDLLFHSIVERSIAATMAFLLSSALNAVVFYRVYVGLFSGPTVKAARPVRRARPLAGFHWLCLGLVLVVILGGFWPALFLP